MCKQLVKGEVIMRVVVTGVISSLVSVAEGAVLAAVVYLVNRGVKHPVNKRLTIRCQAPK